MSIVKTLSKYYSSAISTFKSSGQDLDNKINLLKKETLLLGLTEKQYKILAEHSKLISLRFEDAEPTQKLQEFTGKDLYLIVNGRLNAATRPHPSKPLGKFNEYSSGEVLNLLSLSNLENTVELGQVIEPTTLLVLDMQALRKLKIFQPIYNSLLKNAAHHFSERLQHTEEVLYNTNTVAMKSIERQLEEAKLRVLFGMFVVRMLIILCVYTLSLRGLEILKVDFGDPTIVSTSMMIIVSLFVYNAMMKTQLPLSEFGITTIDWKQSIIEGIIFAFLLFLAMLLIKWSVISFIPEYHSLPLFDFNTGINSAMQVTSWKQFSIMLIYILFAPVQEFLVRGGLQGSLHNFLTGTEHKRIWLSIIISNLIFMTFHTHISPLFSLLALIPGIAWGFLYARHRTLIGVTISHIIVGVTVIFLLGITGSPTDIGILKH